jgi:hypothetical protein
MMHFTRDRLQQQLQFIVAQSCPAANALVEYGYAAFLFGCFTASSLKLGSRQNTHDFQYGRIKSLNQA